MSDDDREWSAELRKAYDAPPPRPEFVAGLQERLKAELKPRHRVLHVLFHRLTLTAAALLLAMGGGWLWWQNSQLRAARDRQAALRNEAEAGLRKVLAAADSYDRAVQGEKPVASKVRLKRQEWLQSAVQGYQTLAKTDGSTDSVQLKMARAYLRLAEATAAAGGRAQAIEQYRQGLAILGKLVEERPRVASYRDEIAAGYHNLGVLYREIGQSALADRAFQQALDSYRQIEAAPGDDPALALKLGDLYSERALALAAAGDWNQALDWYARAIQTLEGVPPPRLQADEAWRVLFFALTGRSRTLTAQGRTWR